MRRFLSRPVVAALLIALPLASCSEQQSPSEPAVPPSALAPSDSSSDLLGSLTDPLVETTKKLLTGVIACPSDETYTATKRIGPKGGKIEVGPHELNIPRGALEREVTITATAPAGDVTTIEFEPHGLRFDRSAALTMSYAHCGLISTLTKHVVYVDKNLKILEVLPSVDDILKQEVTGKLTHFSVYAVAE